ncbi:sterol carrier protein 2-like [Humulus lupulus]|uniref:sterol carrier protein 2-like n=1 Tax=Humulus lupulus TaxID=3486 RepID=UPI002B40838D|nr:sterol carrier protein 2-like [Humulus lupulus]
MATGQFKAETLFDLMKQHFETEEGKHLCKKVNLVYQINLAPKKIGIDEVCYTIDLKNAKVFKGTLEGEEKPDATFSFKEDDFVKIALGKMNPQIAFMRGVLKIKGSLSAAQKFTPDIFPKLPVSKL